MSQIDNMKIKLGIAGSEQDSLLQLYLDDAAEHIKAIGNLYEVPASLLSTQVDLAIVYFNKQGIEGQTSHSEGGISRSFEDIPESLMKRIKTLRKLPRSVI